ncbi:hypothetical protein ACLKA7_000665, partial [Drosophila subpalustris]
MSSSCFDEVDMVLMPEPDAESLHEEDREEDVDDAEEDEAESYESAEGDNEEKGDIEPDDASSKRGPGRPRI